MRFKLPIVLALIVFFVPVTVYAALPGTSTYKLNSYGFGSGGTANSTTSNYALEGLTGEVTGQTSATSNYSGKPGFIETQQANVPKLSAFDNGSGTYYNKLHFVIDQQGNPTDATYALSISTDNFVSDIRYVKSDLTVGSSLTTADYLSYTAWGGASGSNIIGLLPNTTYKLRAKATQGKFTESAYGPASSAATVIPQLSFSLTPTSLNLGSLIANSVVSAPSTIDLTFATNAAAGGDIYISSLNSGLLSTATGNTIPSATGDLSSLSNGFGAQVTTTTMTKVSPYDGSSNSVGITSPTVRKIITTSAPVSSGSGSVIIKAKSKPADKAANDYRETVTMLAAASF